MTKALMVDAREKDSFDFWGLSIRLKVDGNQTDLCQRSGLTFPAL